MSEPTPSNPVRGEGWEPAAITAAIVITAAIAMGYWAVRGLGVADTEAMESPLMMVVARQLTAGPRELYGPYGGTNPLVLIHAPLYYRVAGVAAWPIWKAGLHPVDAARLAGRGISALGLVATLAAAYRLGRIGGRSRRAGWWSVLLLAASPMLAGFPFAVRPDLLGVALQTWGIVLTLESIGEGRRRLVAASILFGLAVCVKQHLLAAWGVGLLVMLTGRGGKGALVRLALPGIAIAALIYGMEWVVTSGRIWDAAFMAASRIGQVHPGGLDMVIILFLMIVDRSAGAWAMIAVGVLGLAASRPGIRRSIATFGTSLYSTGLFVGAFAHFYYTGPRSGAALFLALTIVAALTLITCVFLRNYQWSDVILAACLGTELAMAAILSHKSAGAWVNYGIPASVFASVVGARVVVSAIERRAPRSVLRAMVVASAVVVFADLTVVKEAIWDHDRLRALTASLYEKGSVPRSSMFFADQPGLNRLNGRLELVYDDWLYPVFEVAGLAEPRARWLPRAIATDPVRAVINPTPNPVIPGTSIDLRRFRYRPGVSVAPYFYMWVR